MKYALLVTVAMLALPLAAMAQTALPPATDMPASSATAASLSAQDAHFTKIAAQAGLAEVQDGLLAETKGDASVQSLARMMVEDHTKANHQLTQIAAQKGVTAPATVSAKDAAMTAKLQALGTSRFDAKYLSEQTKAHERAIALFKAEIASGSDPDLKSFAVATLPVLEHHLAMIEAAVKTG